jgi:hypothetical protein
MLREGCFERTRTKLKEMLQRHGFGQHNIWAPMPWLPTVMERAHFTYNGVLNCDLFAFLEEMQD